jgi:hypothetical protein
MLHSARIDQTERAVVGDCTVQAALRLLQLLDRPPFLLLQELLYLSLGAVQLAIDRNVKVVFLRAMVEQVGVLGIYSVFVVRDA